MKWNLKKYLVLFFQLLEMIQKLPLKNKTCDPDSPMSPKRKYKILKDSRFSFSNLMPPTLKPSQKLEMHREASLTSQLSTEKFQFFSQLTSLFMVSTP